MSAYLYYRHDSPVLSDADYDGLHKLVLPQWGKLEPIRKWQLGSRAEIAATGYHVKVTPYAEHAARAWFEDVFNRPLVAETIKKWKRHEKFGRWANITD